MTSASLIICYKFIMKLRRLLECKILNKKNRPPEFEVDQADRMISELHIHSTTWKQPEYRRNFLISELFQEVIIFRLIILHIRLGVRRSNKIITKFNKKKRCWRAARNCGSEGTHKVFSCPSLPGFCALTLIFFFCHWIFLIHATDFAEKEGLLLVKVRCSLCWVRFVFR